MVYGGSQWKEPLLIQDPDFKILALEEEGGTFPVLNLLM